MSRNHDEDEYPTEFMPVHFCRLRDVDTFCIGTTAPVKASGEKVPQIHGAHETLDPHKKARATSNFVGGRPPPKKSMPTPDGVSINRHPLQC